MHRFMYSQVNDRPIQWKARCRCGFTTGTFTSVKEVDDDIAKHDANVERARVARTTKTPSLSSQRDYYLSRAEDPDASSEDRRLWKQLADELTARLGEGIPRWAPEETLI